MILNNLLLRVLYRIREIPSRGLPHPGRHDSFDKTHGTDTSGVVWLTNPSSPNFPRGVRYEPCQPNLCMRAIETSGILPEKFCFVDVGCGKGRALIIASLYQFHELIGVEYSRKLCQIAERNLKRCGIHAARIVCQDATEVIYPSMNTFAFFYHPFGDAAVLDRVLELLRRSGTATN